MKKYQLYIDGKWQDSSSNEFYDVINPATEEVIAKVPKGNKQDVDKAINAARSAFEEWKNTTPASRSLLLFRLADILEKNLREFAKLESLNTGKTLKYASESDYPFTIDNLRFFAGAARTLRGLSAGEYANFEDKQGKLRPLGTSFIRREPVGVVGAIVPWNYPLFIAVWKIAPALAAGNTLVIKPASYTPLTLLEFAKLVERVGFPKGVFNVVTGSGEEVGSALASSSKIDMIAFTGDTETGKKIIQMSASNIRKVHLELGGKAPFIVLEDADLDTAVKGATAGAFWNTGQDCTAVTRIYVLDKIYDKFLKMLVHEVKRIKVGNPLKPDIDLGPLISRKQLERVMSFIEEGKKSGKLVYGGKRIGNKGFFIEPAVFTELPHQSKLCKEEIFGPVLAVYKYKEIEEAISKANDVVYGLVASVWGKDITQCIRIARELKFGAVWINEHGALFSEMPHGGYKQSGFGKDLSLYSLEDFTQIKHIYIDQTNMARKPWHYVVYGKP
jgi:betaine-aldehyde dehydrogenase